MKKTLIIVESPTKVKTLEKFLGKEYVVDSSVGHIIDLPQKGLNIDIENDFAPNYVPLPAKKDVIERLKREAKKVDQVLLATDPDREGEAIAWHIASILPKIPHKRVTFNEITKGAVLEALKHPRKIDDDLVNAQQARRILDRLVGYKISPILIRKVKGTKSLSAGRVQSVALKLIVEREEAIEAFKPEEYWNLASILESKKEFKASLWSIDGKKVERSIQNEAAATKIEKDLLGCTYTVSKIERRERTRNPAPPFTTSTLQQEASRHYGFSSTRTMQVAQGLYEGVDCGEEGAVGLITYMRTDSPRSSPEAIKEARDWIKKQYGEEYLPKTANMYQGKRAAQDAHEGIRPTSVTRRPEDIKRYLSIDEFKLYQLIYRRFLASQMEPAIYDTVTAHIDTNKKYEMKATGSQIKFQGFLALYEEKEDEEKEEERILPPLEEGQKLKLVKVTKDQAFTKPLPRFTEASLVKELEKLGIGRPSTYAAIMNKIQSRDYTTKEKGSLRPTELGRIISRMLSDNFTQIIDVSFTAHMEEDLDSIAEGKLDYKRFLKEFWDVFLPIVEVAEKEAHVPKEMTEKICPECGKHLQKIWARGKYFLGCSGYPDCKYTAPLEEMVIEKDQYDPSFDWDQDCPNCGKKMMVRKGKFGIFLGCSGYPDCKTIINIPKKGSEGETTLEKCPAKGCPGMLKKRMSRYGKPFFSCSTYPECDVIGNSVEEIQENYHGRARTKAVPKTGGGGARGKQKLSKELQALTKEDNLTRGEVTKRIWAYIKDNNLQDPKNKKMIIPDKVLQPILGKEPVHMLKLAGALSRHFV
jgi:DNA topoisomerase-1